MDKFRENARNRLAAFLPRAMEDGVLDETEKAELMGILTSGVLTKDDVQEIFRGFLEGMQAGVMADGQLSPEERERCRDVVSALRIPKDFLSPDLLWIVDPE